VIQSQLELVEGERQQDLIDEQEYYAQVSGLEGVNTAGQWGEGDEYCRSVGEDEHFKLMDGGK